MGNNFTSLMPNSSIPFVYENLESEKKEITVKVDDKSNNYKLDQICQLKQLQSKSGKKLNVELKVEKDYKELVITNPEKSKHFEIGEKGNIFKLILMNKIILKCFLVSIDIQTICVSMIDSDPKEVLLVSLRNPSLKFGKKVSYHSLEIDQNLDLIVDHIQVDNMATMENPVIFRPCRLLQNEESKEEENEEYTPFLQAKIEKHISKSNKTERYTFPCIMVAVQEMVLDIETKTINNILLAARKIFDVFIQDNNEFLSAKFIKQREISLEDSKNQIQNYDRLKLCPLLDASVPSISDKDYVQEQKTYFQLINIGALKITVTIRLDQTELDMSIKQGFGLYSIGYNVISRIARITDSKLTFPELTMTHIFSSPKNAMEMIQNYFVQKAVSQFYMLIGSSDFIGNPIGLVNKLGSGFSDFVNEPRKGLIKGPTGFVGGVGRGVSSLIGNVTSATFGSFSQITGSLYGLSKDLSAQQVKRQEAPKGIADGIYKGATGGVSEIASGKVKLFD